MRSSGSKPRRPLQASRRKTTRKTSRTTRQIRRAHNVTIKIRHLKNNNVDSTTTTINNNNNTINGSLTPTSRKGIGIKLLSYGIFRPSPTYLRQFIDINGNNNNKDNNNFIKIQRSNIKDDINSPLYSNQLKYYKPLQLKQQHLPPQNIQVTDLDLRTTRATSQQQQEQDLLQQQNPDENYISLLTPSLVHQRLAFRRHILAQKKQLITSHPEEGRDVEYNFTPKNDKIPFLNQNDNNNDNNNTLSKPTSHIIPLEDLAELTIDPYTQIQNPQLIGDPVVNEIKEDATRFAAPSKLTQLFSPKVINRLNKVPASLFVLSTSSSHRDKYQRFGIHGKGNNNDGNDNNNNNMLMTGGQQQHLGNNNNNNTIGNNNNNNNNHNTINSTLDRFSATMQHNTGLLSTKTNFTPSSFLNNNSFLRHVPPKVKQSLLNYVQHAMRNNPYSIVHTIAQRTRVSRKKLRVKFWKKQKRQGFPKGRHRRMKRALREYYNQQRWDAWKEAWSKEVARHPAELPRSEAQKFWVPKKTPSELELMVVEERKEIRRLRAINPNDQVAQKMEDAIEESLLKSSKPPKPRTMKRDWERSEEPSILNVDEFPFRRKKRKDLYNAYTYGDASYPSDMLDSEGKQKRRGGVDSREISLTDQDLMGELGHPVYPGPFGWTSSPDSLDKDVKRVRFDEANFTRTGKRIPDDLERLATEEREDLLFFEYNQDGTPNHAVWQQNFGPDVFRHTLAIRDFWREYIRMRAGRKRKKLWRLQFDVGGKDREFIHLLYRSLESPEQRAERHKREQQQFGEDWVKSDTAFVPTSAELTPESTTMDEDGQIIHPKRGPKQPGLKSSASLLGDPFYDPLISPVARRRAAQLGQTGGFQKSPYEPLALDPFFRKEKVDYTLKWPTKGNYCPIPPGQPPGLVPVCAPYTDLYTTSDFELHTSDYLDTDNPGRVFDTDDIGHWESWAAPPASPDQIEQLWDPLRMPSIGDPNELDPTTLSEDRSATDIGGVLVQKPSRISRGKDKKPTGQGLYMNKYDVDGRDIVSFPGRYSGNRLDPNFNPDDIKEAISPLRLAGGTHLVDIMEKLEINPNPAYTKKNFPIENWMLTDDVYSDQYYHFHKDVMPKANVDPVTPWENEHYREALLQDTLQVNEDLLLDEFEKFRKTLKREHLLDLDIELAKAGQKPVGDKHKEDRRYNRHWKDQLKTKIKDDVLKTKPKWYVDLLSRYKDRVDAAIHRYRGDGQIDSIVGKAAKAKYTRIDPKWQAADLHDDDDDGDSVDPPAPPQDNPYGDTYVARADDGLESPLLYRDPERAEWEREQKLKEMRREKINRFGLEGATSDLSFTDDFDAPRGYGDDGYNPFQDPDADDALTDEHFHIHEQSVKLQIEAFDRWAAQRPPVPLQDVDGRPLEIDPKDAYFAHPAGVRFNWDVLNEGNDDFGPIGEYGKKPFDLDGAHTPRDNPEDPLDDKVFANHQARREQQNSVNKRFREKVLQPAKEMGLITKLPSELTPAEQRLIDRIRAPENRLLPWEKLDAFGFEVSASELDEHQFNERIRLKYGFFQRVPETRDPLRHGLTFGHPGVPFGVGPPPNAAQEELMEFLNREDTVQREDYITRWIKYLLARISDKDSAEKHKAVQDLTRLMLTDHARQYDWEQEMIKLLREGIGYEGYFPFPSRLKEMERAGLISPSGQVLVSDLKRDFIHWETKNQKFFFKEREPITDYEEDLAAEDLLTRRNVDPNRVNLGKAAQRYLGRDKVGQKTKGTKKGRAYHFDRRGKKVYHDDPRFIRHEMFRQREQERVARGEIPSSLALRKTHQDEYGKRYDADLTPFATPRKMTAKEKSYLEDYRRQIKIHRPHLLNVDPHIVETLELFAQNDPETGILPASLMKQLTRHAEPLPEVGPDGKHPEIQPLDMKRRLQWLQRYARGVLDGKILLDGRIVKSTNKEMKHLRQLEAKDKGVPFEDSDDDTISGIRGSISDEMLPGWDEDWDFDDSTTTTTSPFTSDQQQQPGGYTNTTTTSASTDGPQFFGQKRKPPPSAETRKIIESLDNPNWSSPLPPPRSPEQMAADAGLYDYVERAPSGLERAGPQSAAKQTPPQTNFEQSEAYRLRREEEERIHKEMHRAKYGYIDENKFGEDYDPKDPEVELKEKIEKELQVDDAQVAENRRLAQQDPSKQIAPTLAEFAEREAQVAKRLAPGTLPYGGFIKPDTIKEPKINEMRIGMHPSFWTVTDEFLDKVYNHEGQEPLNADERATAARMWMIANTRRALLWQLENKVDNVRIQRNKKYQQRLLDHIDRMGMREVDHPRHAELHAAEHARQKEMWANLPKNKDFEADSQTDTDDPINQQQQQKKDKDGMRQSSQSPWPHTYDTRWDPDSDVIYDTDFELFRDKTHYEDDDDVSDGYGDDDRPTSPRRSKVAGDDDDDVYDNEDKAFKSFKDSLKSRRLDKKRKEINEYARWDEFTDPENSDAMDARIQSKDEQQWREAERKWKDFTEKKQRLQYLRTRVVHLKEHLFRTKGMEYDDSPGRWLEIDFQKRQELKELEEEEKRLKEEFLNLHRDKVDRIEEEFNIKYADDPIEVVRPELGQKLLKKEIKLQKLKERKQQFEELKEQRKLQHFARSEAIKNYISDIPPPPRPKQVFTSDGVATTVVGKQKQQPISTGPQKWKIDLSTGQVIGVEAINQDGTPRYDDSQTTTTSPTTTPSSPSSQTRATTPYKKYIDPKDAWRTRRHAERVAGLPADTPDPDELRLRKAALQQHGLDVLLGFGKKKYEKKLYKEQNPDILNASDGDGSDGDDEFNQVFQGELDVDEIARRMLPSTANYDDFTDMVKRVNHVINIAAGEFDDADNIKTEDLDERRKLERQDSLFVATKRLNDRVELLKELYRTQKAKHSNDIHALELLAYRRQYSWNKLRHVYEPPELTQIPSGKYQRGEKVPTGIIEDQPDPFFSKKDFQIAQKRKHDPNGNMPTDGGEDADDDVELSETYDYDEATEDVFEKWDPIKRGEYDLELTYTPAKKAQLDADPDYYTRQRAKQDGIGHDPTTPPPDLPDGVVPPFERQKTTTTATIDDSSTTKSIKPIPNQSLDAIPDSLTVAERAQKHFLERLEQVKKDQNQQHEQMLTKLLHKRLQNEMTMPPVVEMVVNPLNPTMKTLQRQYRHHLLKGYVPEAEMDMYTHILDKIGATATGTDPLFQQYIIRVLERFDVPQTKFKDMGILALASYSKSGKVRSGAFKASEDPDSDADLDKAAEALKLPHEKTDYDPKKPPKDLLNDPLGKERAKHDEAVIKRANQMLGLREIDELDYPKDENDEKQLELEELARIRREQQIWATPPTPEELKQGTPAQIRQRQYDAYMAKLEAQRQAQLKMDEEQRKIEEQEKKQKKKENTTENEYLKKRKELVTDLYGDVEHNALWKKKGIGDDDDDLGLSSSSNNQFSNLSSTTKQTTTTSQIDDPNLVQRTIPLDNTVIDNIQRPGSWMTKGKHQIHDNLQKSDVVEKTYETTRAKTDAAFHDKMGAPDQSLQSFLDYLRSEGEYSDFDEKNEKEEMEALRQEANKTRHELRQLPPDAPHDVREKLQQAADDAKKAYENRPGTEEEQKRRKEYYNEIKRVKQDGLKEAYSHIQQVDDAQHQRLKLNAFFFPQDSLQQLIHRFPTQRIKPTFAQQQYQQQQQQQQMGNIQLDQQTQEKLATLTPQQRRKFLWPDFDTWNDTDKLAVAALDPAFDQLQRVLAYEAGRGEMSKQKPFIVNPDLNNPDTIPPSEDERDPTRWYKYPQSGKPIPPRLDPAEAEEWTYTEQEVDVAPDAKHAFQHFARPGQGPQKETRQVLIPRKESRRSPDVLGRLETKWKKDAAIEKAKDDGTLAEHLRRQAENQLEFPDNVYRGPQVPEDLKDKHNVYKPDDIRKVAQDVVDKRLKKDPPSSPIGKRPPWDEVQEYAQHLKKLEDEQDNPWEDTTTKLKKAITTASSTQTTTRAQKWQKQTSALTGLDDLLDSDDDDDYALKREALKQTTIHHSRDDTNNQQQQTSSTSPSQKQTIVDIPHQTTTTAPPRQPPPPRRPTQQQYGDIDDSDDYNFDNNNNNQNDFSRPPGGGSPPRPSSPQRGRGAGPGGYEESSDSPPEPIKKLPFSSQVFKPSAEQQKYNQPLPSHQQVIQDQAYVRSSTRHAALTDPRLVNEADPTKIKDFNVIAAKARKVKESVVAGEPDSMIDFLAAELKRQEKEKKENKDDDEESSSDSFEDDETKATTRRLKAQEMLKTHRARMNVLKDMNNPESKKKVEKAVQAEISRRAPDIFGFHDRLLRESGLTHHARDDLTEIYKIQNIPAEKRGPGAEHDFLEDPQSRDVGTETEQEWRTEAYKQGKSYEHYYREQQQEIKQKLQKYAELKKQELEDVRQGKAVKRPQWGTGDPLKDAWLPPKPIGWDQWHDDSDAPEQEQQQKTKEKEKDDKKQPKPLPDISNIHRMSIAEQDKLRAEWLKAALHNAEIRDAEKKERLDNLKELREKNPKVKLPVPREDSDEPYVAYQWERFKQLEKIKAENPLVGRYLRGKAQNLQRSSAYEEGIKEEQGRLAQVGYDQIIEQAVDFYKDEAKEKQEKKLNRLKTDYRLAELALYEQAREKEQEVTKEQDKKIHFPSIFRKKRIGNELNDEEKRIYNEHKDEYEKFVFDRQQRKLKEREEKLEKISKAIEDGVPDAGYADPNSYSVEFTEYPELFEYERKQDKKRFEKRATAEANQENQAAMREYRKQQKAEYEKRELERKVALWDAKQRVRQQGHIGKRLEERLAQVEREFEQKYPKEEFPFDDNFDDDDEEKKNSNDDEKKKKEKLKFDTTTPPSSPTRPTTTPNKIKTQLWGDKEDQSSTIKFTKPSYPPSLDDEDDKLRQQQQQQQQQEEDDKNNPFAKSEKMFAEVHEKRRLREKLRGIQPPKEAELSLERFYALFPDPEVRRKVVTKYEGKEWLLLKRLGMEDQVKQKVKHWNQKLDELQKADASVEEIYKQFRPGSDTVRKEWHTDESEHITLTESSTDIDVWLPKYTSNIDNNDKNISSTGSSSSTTTTTTKDNIEKKKDSSLQQSEKDNDDEQHEQKEEEQQQQDSDDTDNLLFNPYNNNNKGRYKLRKEPLKGQPYQEQQLYEQRIQKLLEKEQELQQENLTVRDEFTQQQKQGKKRVLKPGELDEDEIPKYHRKPRPVVDEQQQQQQQQMQQQQQQQYHPQQQQHYRQQQQHYRQQQPEDDWRTQGGGPNNFPMSDYHQQQGRGGRKM